MSSGELAQRLRGAALRRDQEVYVRGEVVATRPLVSQGAAGPVRVVEVAAEEVQVRS